MSFEVQACKVLGTEISRLRIDPKTELNMAHLSVRKKVWAAYIPPEMQRWAGV